MSYIWLNLFKNKAFQKIKTKTICFLESFTKGVYSRKEENNPERKVCNTQGMVSKQISKLQIRSVAQLCLTLCDPMDCSTPGLPVHHQLPEFTQTHVHSIGHAIQPSHPLWSPSPPAPNPSQHQSLFQ